jgi:hypothetical protein
MGRDSILLLGTLIKFNANMPDVKSNGIRPCRNKKRKIWDPKIASTFQKLMNIQNVIGFKRVLLNRLSLNNPIFKKSLKVKKFLKRV